MNIDRRREIDLLVEEFWKKGYLTVFRKLGTYLPEPTAIGGFEVDVIAKQRGNFAIGITLTEQDFKDSTIIKNKLSYLAQRQTKGTKRKVQLFVGVSSTNYKYAKTILDELDPETKRNIKLFQIVEKPDYTFRVKNKSDKVLFS